MDANTARGHASREDQSQTARETSIPTKNMTSISAEDVPDKDVQHGIQAAEAVTVIWNRKSLVVAYAMYVSFPKIRNLMTNFT